MAKLVTKFKYLPPSKANRGGYAIYIATRDGVEKIDDSKRHKPATKKQKRLIEDILRDFPDAEEMLEYEDYRQNPTIGNAHWRTTRARFSTETDTPDTLPPVPAPNGMALTGCSPTMMWRFNLPRWRKKSMRIKEIFGRSSCPCGGRTPSGWVMKAASSGGICSGHRL